jgi:hypothetical protein
LLDPGARESMRSSLAVKRPENGAAPAASWLQQLASTERQRKPSQRRWKRYAAHPIASARAAAPFAARVPGALGRIAHQTVTRPKARVLIDATGHGAEEIERLLPAALYSAGEPTDRVLVLVDTVGALPVLRRLGVGAEHVVAPGREELILAERPRMRRVLALRDVPDTKGTLKEP